MLKLAALDSIAPDEFTRLIGPVFEHSPWIAERAAARRPFSTRDNLHAELVRTMMDATRDEKLGLVRAHPDLATRLELTPASQQEQSAAGLADIPDDDRREFRERNLAYRERFGFPFVICARMNDKETMLRALTSRLNNAPEAELENALAEIANIARLRLADLIDE